MQNLHDDNLDNLSRKAAEQFELDQDVHSWQQLQSRLDTELPQKKEKKRRFLIIFLLFLLIGGGLVFSGILNTEQQTASVENADKTKDEVTQKTNSPGDQTGTKEQQEATEKNNAPTSKSVTDPASSAPNETAKAGNAASDQVNGQQKPATLKDNISRPQSTVTSVNSSNRNTTTSTNNPATRTNSPLKQKRKPGTVTGAIAGSETIDALTSQKKLNDAIPDNTVTDLTAKASDNATPDRMDPESSEVDETIKNADKPTLVLSNPPLVKNYDAWKHPATSPTKNKPRNRWEFGVTYAPDISTVKFTHTQPPGQNIGITIGYNFSNRFSLQTGAIYTTKNYKMNGSDYHPPKGYWTDYYKIETVSGECDMWDIPLNLRYNIAPRKKSNFFVSTGLSSYLMQEEDYDFFYYYNGNPTTRYRSMDTARRCWMSILNISAGYERQIGKTFSLQVEPFFKQPLTGIGFGNMKLNSTGVYFTLKYKPLSRR